MPAAEVFSDVGLLPGLIKRADQLCSLCFGLTSGASYVDDSKAVMGSKIILPQGDMPIELYYCLLDSFIELSKGAKNTRVDLDELLYD